MVFILGEELENSEYFCDLLLFAIEASADNFNIWDDFNRSEVDHDPNHFDI